MTTKIHSSAVVHPKAQLDVGVTIGAFCVVGEYVVIGKDTVLESHVVVANHTTLGKGNAIYSFNSIGGVPGDLKYDGEPTRLEIGDNNTIKEGTTIHIGTALGGGVTRIGNNNLVMPYAHVAHDCQIGNDTVLGFSSVFAGHVVIKDGVNLGGKVSVVQHCRIGDYAYVTADVLIAKDVPPFVIVEDGPRGVNRIGMKRNGFSEDRIRIISNAFKVIYRQNLRLVEAIEALKAMNDPDGDIKMMIDMIADTGGRGIVRCRNS